MTPAEWDGHSRGPGSAADAASRCDAGGGIVRHLVASIVALVPVVLAIVSIAAAGSTGAVGHRWG